MIAASRLSLPWSCSNSGLLRRSVPLASAVAIPVIHFLWMHAQNTKQVRIRSRCETDARCFWVPGVNALFVRRSLVTLPRGPGRHWPSALLPHLVGRYEAVHPRPLRQTPVAANERVPILCVGGGITGFGRRSLVLLACPRLSRGRSQRKPRKLQRVQSPMKTWRVS